LKVYGNQPFAKGLICLPLDNKLVEVEVSKKGNIYQVEKGMITGVKYLVR